MGKNKMKFLTLMSCALISMSVSQADLVKKIETRTADCDDCGMSNTFGDLRLEICNSLRECCTTAELDNRFENDFEKGQVDTFDDHSILNQCDEFDMKNSQGSSIMMTLMHSGSDGYQADYIQVGTDTGTYQCNFGKFLDGDDSETGFSCAAF